MIVRISPKAAYLHEIRDLAEPGCTPLDLPLTAITSSGSRATITFGAWGLAIGIHL